LSSQGTTVAPDAGQGYPGRSLVDPIRWWWRKTPDSKAIVTRSRSVTYRQLWPWMRSIAGYLRSRGLQPGDRVSIIGANNAEWCVLALGILAADAVVAPLNTRWVEREIAHGIADSRPRLIFADDDKVSGVAKMVADGRMDAEVVPFSVITALEDPPADADPDVTLTRGGSDLAVLVYTSGSTSMPKGVMFTHDGVLAAAFESSLADPAFGDHPKYLLCLPMPGCAGIIRGLLINLIPGGTLYLENGVDPDYVIRLIARERITIFNSQPYIFERIAESPLFGSADFSSLRLTTVAGAPVAPSLLAKYIAHGVLLRQAWGQTEVSGSCVINAPGLAVSNPEFCGRATVFTRLRVVRADGSTCEPDEAGEIVMQGPCVTPGYWNDPEATAAALIDGWFRSGDIGRFDEDGNLIFVGRKKEIIISGGINIAPAEIEVVLGDAPGVVEAVVLGVPDSRFGEAVAAVIRVADETTLADVQRYCFERLADYKVPRRIIVAGQPLPRLPTGKLARPMVRAEYATALESLQPVVYAERSTASSNLLLPRRRNTGMRAARRKVSNQPRLIVAAAGLGLALAVAACASSSTGSGAASATIPSKSSPASSGTVLDIGLANMNTGTTSFPGLTQAAQLAAEYLNQTAGGIDNHKIAIVSCDVKNDAQSSQECGQEFADDSSMPFAMSGLNFNAGPYYTAMTAAHKPTLGGSATTPADYAAPDTYFYFPGGNFYQSAAADILSLNPRPKSVSMIYEGEASTISFEKIEAQVMKENGIAFKAVEVPPGAADVTAQVAESGAGTADFVDVSVVNCLAVAEAFRALNIVPRMVRGSASCPTTTEAESNAALLNGWIVPSTTKIASAVAPAGDADVTLFNEVWDQHYPNQPVPNFAEEGWGLVMTAAEVLRGAPALTSSAVAQLLQSYKGPVAMGDPSISCPGPAPATSTCANGIIYYQVESGKLHFIAKL
jgi:fatty-acyl-CoA synthase